MGGYGCLWINMGGYGWPGTNPGYGRPLQARSARQQINGGSGWTSRDRRWTDNEKIVVDYVFNLNILPYAEYYPINELSTKPRAVGESSNFVK